MKNEFLESKVNEIIKGIDELIDNFDRENKVREDMANPGSLEEYEKSMEKLQSKVRELQEKIEQKKGGLSNHPLFSR